jgi:putative ABC transport system permease protein
MSKVSNSAGTHALHRWLLAGEWRAHPVRALVALAAIALGIALGFGIQLINEAAFSEFSAAARSLSGNADVQVRSKSVSFDERRYADIAALPEVDVAAPVLELDLAIPGQRTPLKILGIDGFRSAAIAPDLLGLPEESKPFDSLMADTVFLSPAALQWLNLKTGDPLNVIAGATVVKLRIAGTLVRARAGQRLAVMDIGSAQWQFHRIGQLSRIDLRLQPGARIASVSTAIAALDPSLTVIAQDDQDRRTATMSRAYRVNLNVLALVALFTGAFLVFSTQALSVLRRRPQFALLRTMGMTRRELLLQVLAEGAVLGAVGSLLGLLVGYGLAAAALSLFGGDLGGGYFPGVRPSVSLDPAAALLFFLAGVGVALLGSLSPALEAARARPAAALKAGSEDLALAPLAMPWPALIMIITGAVFTLLPPVAGLPVFGYLAIALLLVGSIALMPRLAALAFARLAKRHRGPLASLAMSRLANAPNQAAIALGGVLASFALMVAMAIMVASFRVSVDDWLRHLLSADLYVRVMNGGEAGRLSARDQQSVAALPAVARMEITRHQPITLDAARPSVALIARSIDAKAPERALPMVSDTTAVTGRPVWVSEAMVDLYGWRPGQSVQLPINGQLQRFEVAGIWRDYARQSGAVMMRIDDYRQLSGDDSANDVALWVKRDVTVSMLRQQIDALPFAASLEHAEPGEIHEISLKIFDRSFIITYLLEGVAIVIGLFGVASTFSAQTLSRAKEFGMLRHLGITRGQILALLAGEGALLATLAIMAGFVLGACISLILVFIVNPQSFHWTMELHLPYTLLATMAGVLLLSASLTALVSGRVAVSGSAVRAVREDW